jgi:DNA helicase-2/ATP-dependent DNA helicase PcrA
MSDDFTPTPEQAAILSAAANTSDNLLISALAGAAKTSTLVHIARVTAPTRTLAISFNKRIADEMKDRLPPHVESRTLNSFGHKTWGDNLGKRLAIDAGKVYRLTKSIVDELKGQDKILAYENFSTMLDAIHDGKGSGWIPDDWIGPMTAKPLLDDAAFFGSLDEELSDLLCDIIRALSSKSLTEAFGKGTAPTLDFADQLLLPAVFPVSIPLTPLVLVDEAQDLSELNHVLLHKMAKKRLIAVGDECQSIYGFRGADENSMSNLEHTFHMRRMTLSISFRCPIEIVKAAQWRAPHMKWPEWAKPGVVQHNADWDAQALADDAVILCRNNAPIFSLAFKLLANGRYPQIVGNDLGKRLAKMLKDLCPKGKRPNEVSQTEALASIDLWLQNKLVASRKPDKLRDQAECLRIFVRHGRNLADAIAYAEDVMSRSGPVKLMTIHKAKGLEFENVYFLDEHLIKSEFNVQEQNLRYVAITRSKSTLTYITSEGFHDD